jgi:hypothetical protein
VKKEEASQQGAHAMWANVKRLIFASPQSKPRFVLTPPTLGKCEARPVGRPGLRVAQ